jgi:hypothetical protein
MLRAKRDGATASLLVLALGALIACEASAADPWDRFLQSPDAGSFTELAQEVDGGQCGWGKPENTKVVPDRVRGQLFDLIAGGNENAFLIGLSGLRCFDGGDLEDFYQSAGKFMEQHPQRFLAGVTEKKVPERDIASMASSVPTNDNPAAALKEVAERIEVLSKITDAKVASAQATGIKALQQHEADLKRMPASLKE